MTDPNKVWESTLKSLFEKWPQPVLEISHLLKDIPAEHLRQFLKKGFPTKQDKWWQFSNIEEITQEMFKPVLLKHRHLSDPQPLKDKFFSFSNTHCLHFQNGLSPAPHLKTPLKYYIWPSIQGFPAPDWLIQQLGSPSYKTDAWYHLAGAFTTTGYALFVPDNYQSPIPWHIHFSFDDSVKPRSLWNIRNFIFMGKKSQLSLIESISHPKQGFINAVTHTHHGEESTLQWIKIDKGCRDSYYCHQSFGDMGASSCLDRLNINLGSGLSRDTVHIRQKGPKAQSNILGLCILKNKDHSDQRFDIHHTARQGYSRQFFRGILNDSASSIFHGKTHVSPQAFETDCGQSAKNLLLSNQARSQIQPELEIECSEVQAQHGATSGLMDRDEIFYLQTRGLSEKLAAELLVYGYIKSVLDQFPKSDLMEQINQKFQNNKRQLLNL